MTSTLRHRGPDDEGYYTEPGVGLGMRRLSVIDLAAGHQPMANEDGSVRVVFNGEIYNYRELRQELQAAGHRFATASDTEVLVHLYEAMGPDCVTRLNGMFAFALWDAKRHRLLLARDHLGIKPLYYVARGGRLWFASELKALLADPSVPRTVDAAAVADYFQWLYIPAPYTVFEEIKKLPPGTRLVLSAEGLTVEPYWRLEFQEERSSRADDETHIERLRAALRAAVRRQMVADVPVGVFLSGGVDSSGIVALARECTTGPLQTFSAGFPRMGLYDEAPYARQIAERFGCVHHAIDMTPSAVEALEAVIRACDEPFGDSSAIPLYYLAKVARSSITVALSGTGGDDLFAGYRRYRISQWLPRYQRLPEVLRQGLQRATQWLPAHRRNRWAEWNLLARRFCRAARNGGSTMEAYARTLMCCDEELQETLLLPGTAAHALPVWCCETMPADPLEACLLADLTTYLPDDLLVKEDRMTMAVGLEARVPFLDLDVIRVALSMPARLKLRGGTTKYALREALKPLLPSSITARPKHGFAVPVGEWLRGPLAPMFEELVLSPRAVSRAWVETRAARALFARHRTGREDLSQPLWALLVFEAWCRAYLVG